MNAGCQQADQLERSDTVPSAETLAGLILEAPEIQHVSSEETGSVTQKHAENAAAVGLNEATLPAKPLSVRTNARLAAAHPLSSLASEEAANSSSAEDSPAASSISPLVSTESFHDLAGQALAHSNHLGSKPRHETVSFAAIAKNPSLARLARAELDEHQHTTAIENVDTDGPVGSSAFYAHDAEVERQWTALEAVNAVTKEESTLNKELSSLICARLEASRKSTERFLGVLQALANAESSYAHAMTVVCSISLPGECDGDAMKTALDAFSALPQVVGEAHSDALLSMSGLNKALHALVTELRRVCEEVRSSTAKCLKTVDHASSQMQQSFISHQQACRMFDLALLERRRGKIGRILEQDPWLTESSLVESHFALQQAQEEERRLLTSSHKQLQELEARRVDLIKRIVAAFVAAYRSSLSGAKSSVEQLRAMTEGLDSAADLADLTRSAQAVEDRSQEIASKQAETLQQVSDELLSSPEIVRQGSMERWLPVSSMWQECHFVLTRAGFLHWFHRSTGADHIRPLDNLNLIKCQFEAGEAPTFNIVESNPGRLWIFSSWLRTVAFRAPNVDDCCEWAIAIREAIARTQGEMQ